MRGARHRIRSNTSPLLFIIRKSYRVICEKKITVTTPYFGPMNGGLVFLHLPDYTGSQPRRPSTVMMPPLKSRISQDHSIITWAITHFTTGQYKQNPIWLRILQQWNRFMLSAWSFLYFINLETLQRNKKEQLLMGRKKESYEKCDKLYFGEGEIFILIIRSQVSTARPHHKITEKWRFPGCEK